MRKFNIIAKATAIDFAILTLNIVLIGLLHANDNLNTLLFWVLMTSILLVTFKFFRDVTKKLDKIERKEETEKAIKAALNQAVESLEFPISMMIYHNPDSFSFLQKTPKAKEDYLDEFICKSFFKVNFNHYISRPMDANIYGYGLAYNVSNLTKIAMNRLKDSFHLYSDSIDPKLKVQYQKLQMNNLVFTMLDCNEHYNELIKNNIEKYNYSFEQKKKMQFSFFDYDSQKKFYEEVIEFIFACKKY